MDTGLIVFKCITTFTEVELGYYLAGLIEGDGYFSSKKELSIAFHRKDRMAIENIITALDAGVITDLKNEQSSKLRFYGKHLEKVMKLINGKLVGTDKVTQLINSKCADKFNIVIKPPLLKINVNNYWLAGFMDSDGSVGIHLSQRRSKLETSTFLNLDLGISICFTQKNPELLFLIANLFSGKKVHKNVLKNQRFWFNLTFTSQKEIPFWINYFNNFHLQSRKHWQFLKLKECFGLILKAKKLTSLDNQKTLPRSEKQLARILLIKKALKLQKESREIEIPAFVRSKTIPMFVSRFSLTVTEMDKIDELLKNPQLSFVKIAKEMKISRSLLYRYRKNPEIYRAKPLINPEHRRQNTFFFNQRDNEN